MNEKQQTIKKSVSVSGVGLHTGVSATMTFVPAPPNHGYKFQRVDLPGQPVVDADVDNVVDLSFRGAAVAPVDATNKAGQRQTTRKKDAERER